MITTTDVPFATLSRDATDARGLRAFWTKVRAAEALGHRVTITADRYENGEIWSIKAEATTEIQYRYCPNRCQGSRGLRCLTNEAIPLSCPDCGATLHLEEPECPA